MGPPQQQRAQQRQHEAGGQGQASQRQRPLERRQPDVHDRRPRREHQRFAEVADRRSRQPGDVPGQRIAVEAELGHQLGLHLRWRPHRADRVDGITGGRPDRDVDDEAGPDQEKKAARCAPQGGDQQKRRSRQGAISHAWNEVK
jgi:hypothetical protein